MTIHKLKTWPMYFDAAVDGRKRFELRRNDRGFEVGDLIELHEYSPNGPHYTGRTARFRITFLLKRVDSDIARKGLAPDFVVFGIEPVSVPEQKET